MLIAAAILAFVLLVFTVGKSPVFRVDRAGAAIIGAIATIAAGLLSFEEATAAVDHRTIVILFSMMIVVANLKLAGFFELTGQLLRTVSATQARLLLAVIFASGLLSALCINDIVCLLFTPVVLAVCKKTGAPPLPYLLATAMASNIGSAATLLGNPQNILVASLSGLPFTAYLLTALPFSLIGLFALYGLLWQNYRSLLAAPLPAPDATAPVCHPYLIAKALGVLTLVLGGYALGGDLAFLSGLGGALLLVTRRVKPNKIYTSIDFNLLVMFIGLFVVVGGVEKSGLMTALAERLTPQQLHNPILFSGLTVALSNLVSNVPAVLLLKYFIPATAAEPWWKALALLSTFAGNLTITGSIANLIVAEIAAKEGIRMGFQDYVRVGLPLTIMLCLCVTYWFHLAV